MSEAASANANVESSNIRRARSFSELKSGKLVAYNTIPYALIREEYDGVESDITNEFSEIASYYDIYKKGADFDVEGTGGDYVASYMRYRDSAVLINKEARFLFGNFPDLKVKAEGDAGKVTEEAKEDITNIQNLIDKVFEANMLESALVKGARDCFIGKRVGYILNFDEVSGVTITFLGALDFIYEMDRNNKLTKFVCFVIEKDRAATTDKRIFVKKYQMDSVGGKEVCYVEEKICDGAGTVLEVTLEYQPTLFDEIPAGVIINDGLTGDIVGESEIAQLMDSESYFSKLSNGDMDAERKSMHPTRYTVDMDPVTTAKLSISPGSYWDLTTDQNLSSSSSKVGVLESNLSYSESLKTTLDRIKRHMHEVVEVPDVSIESIQGMITSGKALRAVYWPLIVRCNEKMKTWGPHLKRIMALIYKGAMLYPNTIKVHVVTPIRPVLIEYTVDVNYPIPEDENEEKDIDMAEVGNNLMSKKAYMQKWRNLTDNEVEAELEQMALERQILEDASTDPSAGMEDDEDYSNLDDEEDDTEIDDMLTGLDSEFEGEE